MKNVKINTQKLNKYDIIEITWLDSHSRHGWMSPSEVQEWIKDAKDKMTIKTIGYFIQQDKNFIRICQSHDFQHRKENSEDDNKDGLFAVTKSYISKIEIIKKVK